MHVTAWYHGTTNQSLPNSANMSPLARSLTMPNFDVLRQKVCEVCILWAGAQPTLDPYAEAF